MTNSYNGGQLANEILRSLSAKHGWASYKQEVKAMVQVVAAILQSDAGDYQFSDGQLVHVTSEDGRLFATAFDQKSQTLSESQERFFTVDQGAPPFRSTRKNGGVVELSAEGKTAKRT